MTHIRRPNAVLQQEALTSPINPGSGQGAWWTKNSSPSLPMFTGETGIEHHLGPVEPELASSSQNNVLTLANFAKFSTYSHATAVLLVQDDSDVDFINGAILNGKYEGSGTLTIQADVSNSVTPDPTGKSLVVQPGGWFTLRKKAANVWIVTGALV